MRAYYNEIDKNAAAHLENLIAAGHIAPGDVDTRDIRDVRPSELKGYTQCHFFAGIGVWSHSLRAAGWPDARPVWTGSCPCQPFSAIGRGKGIADERHLWPHWFHLTAECRPPIVFGEQVASKDGLGWLDLVFSDLEGADYALGPVDLCAAGVGAPHIRQRLYFGSYDLWAAPDGLGYGDDTGLQGYAGDVGSGPRRENPSRSATATGPVDRAGVSGRFGPGATTGFWGDADWLLCRDEKWRPVEPGTFPLADGVAGRVGRLRAYGNAIVAPLAQAFIEEFDATLAEIVAGRPGDRGAAWRGTQRERPAVVDAELVEPSLEDLLA